MLSDGRHAARFFLASCVGLSDIWNVKDWVQNLSKETDPYAALQDLGPCMLFYRKYDEFIQVRSAGYNDGFRYTFLSESEDIWTEVFASGYYCAGSAPACFDNRKVWVVIDRVDNPEYLLVVELPSYIEEAGPLLRYMILRATADGFTEELLLANLPPWHRDALNSMLEKSSPVLLMSEEGSGKDELVRAFLERKTRGLDYCLFFQPGRLSESVQLRELFGMAAGGRLGDSGSVVPLVERDADAIVIEEAGNLSPGAQLQLFAYLSENPDRQFWVLETSFDLAAMVEAGLFQGALLQMVEKNSVLLQPVRNFRESIPVEAERIMKQLRNQYRRQIYLSADAIEKMQEYSWPGNWREMKAVLESAFLTNLTGSVGADDLKTGSLESRPRDRLNLRQVLREVERNLMLQAYALHGGNQVQMARALGISRGSLQYKLDRYGLMESGGADE